MHVALGVSVFILLIDSLIGSNPPFNPLDTTAELIPLAFWLALESAPLQTDGAELGIGTIMPLIRFAPLIWPDLGLYNSAEERINALPNTCLVHDVSVSSSVTVSIDSFDLFWGGCA